MIRRFHIRQVTSITQRMNRMNFAIGSNSKQLFIPRVFSYATDVTTQQTQQSSTPSNTLPTTEELKTASESSEKPIEKTPEQIEQEEKDRQRRRKRLIIFLSLAAVLGLVGSALYALFKLIMSGTEQFPAQVDVAENKYSTNSLFVVNCGSQALNEGMQAFLRQINSDAQLRSDVAQVLGDFSSSDQIRLLNSNFVQLMSHKLYFLSSVEWVISAGKFRDNFFETRLHYFFPIINMETGAIAVLKATLRSDQDSSDNLSFESAALCDAEPFVAIFGDLYFTQNYDHFVEKDILYGWKHSKPEIEVFREPSLQNRVKVYFPRMLPPAIQPKVEPVIGYFIPDTINQQFLPPKVPYY